MTRSDTAERQIASRPPRVVTAIRIAAHASSASGCNEVAAPSSRREYKSITVAKYNFPDAVGISVMSYADLRTMPTGSAPVQVGEAARVAMVGIVRGM